MNGPAGLSSPEDLTPQRLRCLAAVAAHVAPLPDGHEGQAASLERYIAHSLTRWPFADQAPLAWALLDELDHRSSPSGSFAALAEEDRESLLREVESDSNPYLTHALVLLVRLSIEASYGAEQRA